MNGLRKVERVVGVVSNKYGTSRQRQVSKRGKSVFAGGVRVD